jgi:hypothetical protein
MHKTREYNKIPKYNRNKIPKYFRDFCKLFLVNQLFIFMNLYQSNISRSESSSVQYACFSCVAVITVRFVWGKPCKCSALCRNARIAAVCKNTHKCLRSFSCLFPAAAGADWPELTEHLHESSYFSKKHAVRVRVTYPISKVEIAKNTNLCVHMQEIIKWFKS